MDLITFDWGWMDKPTNRTLSSGNITKSYGQWHKDTITKEIFEDKLYEKDMVLKYDKEMINS